MKRSDEGEKSMGGYYFPMFVDISTKRILVIGGGKIAARRVRTLLKICRAH